MKSFASRHLRRSILALGISTTLLASSSFAQTESPAKPPTAPSAAACTPASAKQTVPSTLPSLPPCPAKRHTDTSISLGAFSQLTIDRAQSSPDNFLLQSTAPSAGTLGTFRQTFSAWLGYSVNLGYARVSEHYFNSTGYRGGPDSFNANSNMYEASITYVAHTRVDKRFSLFADVGPGLLTFLPFPGGTNPVIDAPDQIVARGLSVQVRPTGVFGTGVDIHLTRHFDLRAEYRALYYKNPDFQTGDTLSKALTLTSEPTLSLVYHFHQTKP